MSSIVSDIRLKGFLFSYPPLWKQRFFSFIKKTIIMTTNLVQLKLLQTNSLKLFCATLLCELYKQNQCFCWKYQSKQSGQQSSTSEKHKMLVLSWLLIKTIHPPFTCTYNNHIILNCFLISHLLVNIVINTPFIRFKTQ